jgi:hypothetical protein
MHSIAREENTRVGKGGKLIAIILGLDRLIVVQAGLALSILLRLFYSCKISVA